LKDTNDIELNTGDVFDIGQTVNGQSEFYVMSIDPMDIRYNYDRERRYEYSLTDLLAPCRFTGESQFTIIDGIDDYIELDIED
jgi:hypothetical protein